MLGTPKTVILAMLDPLAFSSQGDSSHLYVQVGFAIGRNSPGLIPRNRSHFVKDVRRAQRDYLKNYEAVSGLETSKTMGLLYEGGSAAWSI